MLRQRAELGSGWTQIYVQLCANSLIELMVGPFIGLLTDLLNHFVTDFTLAPIKNITFVDMLLQRAVLVYGWTQIYV